MSNEIVNQKRREFLGVSALALSLAVIGVPAMANPVQTQINGFTPVYRGAITVNEPGKVNVHPVTYKLHGLDIAANVYTPAKLRRTMIGPRNIRPSSSPTRTAA
jgi:hypothetical protein